MPLPKERFELKIKIKYQTFVYALPMLASIPSSAFFTLFAGSRLSNFFEIDFYSSLIDQENGHEFLAILLLIFIFIMLLLAFVFIALSIVLILITERKKNKLIPVLKGEYPDDWIT